MAGANFNDDGTVNTTDLGVVKNLFPEPLGPSSFGSCTWMSFRRRWFDARYSPNAPGSGSVWKLDWIIPLPSASMMPSLSKLAATGETGNAHYLAG